jgi:hypothetical protein
MSKVLKLTAPFFLLAIFLCCAGKVSAGSSVTVDAKSHSTFGHPSMALVTADDKYVLVSLDCDVSKQLECAPTTPPALPNESGVQVFDSDFNNPCGGQNIIGFPPPGGQAVTSVDGIEFLPAPNGVSVAAAVEQQGAEFFNLSDVKTCAIDGNRNVINVQQRPVQPPMSCSAQGGGGCYPGSFRIAVTPNGAPGYAFVANEYGIKHLPPPKVNFGLGGTVGVVRVQRNSGGGFSPGTGSIEQNKNIYIPGADTIPGVTVSHDGQRLYVANENARQSEINKKTGNPYWDPTNVANTPNGGIQASQNCQPGGLDQNGKPIEGQNNGLLTIIDVGKATRGGGQGSILVSIASGCSPVRVVETADGKYIWVATRGLNLNLPGTQPGPGPGTSGYQVLAFDVSKLLSKSLNDVNDALVGFGDSGGTAPVGLALFNNDQMLAVANSNRFFSKLPQPAGDTNVAILDVSNPRTPTVITTIPPTPTSADMFPRDVTLGPTNVGDCLADLGCFTLYVPNFDANMLEVIKAQVN